MISNQIRLSQIQKKKNFDEIIIKNVEEKEEIEKNEGNKENKRNEENEGNEGNNIAVLKDTLTKSNKNLMAMSFGNPDNENEYMNKIKSLLNANESDK